MLAGSDDAAANAFQDDVQAVVDEYQAAWNDDDSETFLELVADDDVFMNGSTETEREAQADIIGNGTPSYNDWPAQVIGDPIAAGDGPYLAAMTNHLGWRNSIDGGDIKVSEHARATG